MSRASARPNDREQPKNRPEKVIGGKYVRLLERQLQQLRGEDVHGNRKLFLDDVFCVYLLACFNPTVRSPSSLQRCTSTVTWTRAVWSESKLL